MVHASKLLLWNLWKVYLPISFVISEAVNLHEKSKENVVDVYALQLVLQEGPLSVNSYRPIADEDS